MQKRRQYLLFLTRGLYFIWTLLLLGILTIIIERTYTYAKYIAIQEAKTSVNKDLAYRSWVASHGGVYVPVDKKTQPNPYLSHIKERDFTALGKKYTLMNPAYTLSQMMHDYTKLYGVKTHITSKKLLNPKNKPDEWETLALNEIERSRKQYYELNKINDEEYLRLMNPLVTKKSCLKCHAFQGYKVGDIRGGVSVSIPMRPLYKDALKSSLLVAALFFIIWLAGMLIIRYFIKKTYKYIDEQEEMYEQYIYGLVNIVEKRDTYTAGHSSRVASYAALIAKEMGISQEQIHTLHRAGMLHDIGKIAIPDSVFLKPSRLMPEEYKLIQEHVIMSYEILNKIAIFDDIKEVVRDHHEHYDGSGYPRGLRGDETPILAQILTLADSFDAMTTDRIYKGRKSVAEALEEIEALSGKQFNPNIVQAALKALQGIKIQEVPHQKPQNMLERERFSYFYKDALTGLYNETSLTKDIHTIQNYKHILWISLKGFHNFNKTKGWNAGDDLLKEIAEILKNNFSKESLLYRFYGDNFLVFTNSKKEIENTLTILNERFDDKEVTVDVKHNTKEITADMQIESLRDVLQKLF
ncbi:HD domain-containing phosphohydrolase [Sulfurimonas paralvinellae]|uniref:DUF3365 domain-containing protein n=1 Tax=Sulfurimonas paralvinellae TaxID=317658 RepID=A0A7M1BA18_9BACT|nr:HD domain-containing phosphohydrolase [Sulfurimonas paralvinellae]QOP46559.1 DUF3365 domain-containing protein [Sulfurimonas paralvinellae]